MTVADVPKARQAVGSPMRFEDIYVCGVGSWLPPPVAAADALASGLCDAATVHRDDVASVVVASGTSEIPAEMAARAARVALLRSGHEPGDIDLILHASLYDQAFDLWAPASYVQRTAVGNRCPAMEVRQVSNGGMAALELAIAYLSAAPGRTAALLTAADRFDLPGFDRWRSDPGTVYADGGGAMVISTRSGFARVRSLVLGSDPDLEGMHRTGPAFAAPPVAARSQVDLEACKRGFLTEVGLSFGASRAAAGQREVVKAALADADTDLDALDHVVLPNFGRRRLDKVFGRVLGLDLDRTTWAWSRRVGHLGAADQFAGLAHLIESDALKPGDRCAVLGVGAGFSWSCAVLEIVARPEATVDPRIHEPAQRTP